jgi:hypothetical protein
VAVVAIVKIKALVFSNHTVRMGDFISMNNFSEQENLHGMNDLDNMLLEELEEASDSETEDLLTRIILNRPRRHAHSFSVEIPRFDLGDYSDEECVNLFRFTTTQLAELIHHLRIPGSIIAPNRSRATGIEALCITLRRLAYPNRWHDLRYVFGRQASELSLFFTEILEHIFKHFSHLLDLHQDRCNVLHVPASRAFLPLVPFVVFALHCFRL